MYPFESRTDVNEGTPFEVRNPECLGNMVYELLELLFILLQRLLRGLARGDILERRDVLVRRTVGLSNGGDGRLDPDHAPFAMQETGLELNTVRICPVELLHRLVSAELIFRDDEVLNAPAHELVFAVREYSAHLFVDRHDPVVGVQFHDAHCRMMKACTDALIGAAQAFLQGGKLIVLAPEGTYKEHDDPAERCIKTQAREKVVRSKSGNSALVNEVLHGWIAYCCNHHGRGYAAVPRCKQDGRENGRIRKCLAQPRTEYRVGGLPPA